MIDYEGRIVGSVWVDLKQVDSVPSPAVHVMIGDPSARGKGVGFLAVGRVVEFLAEQGNHGVYSRHLTKNNGARGLLDALGFQNMGKPYTDENGLEWQNVEKIIR